MGGREDGFVVQVTLDVGGQGAGRLIAPVAVLLQGLHHDPVQVAAQQPAELAGLRAGDAREIVDSRLAWSVLTRVLGRGGSSSRMMRRISS